MEENDNKFQNILNPIRRKLDEIDQLNRKFFDIEKGQLNDGEKLRMLELEYHNNAANKQDI